MPANVERIIGGSVMLIMEVCSVFAITKQYNLTDFIVQETL